MNSDKRFSDTQLLELIISTFLVLFMLALFIKVLFY